MKKGGAFVCAALTLIFMSVMFPARADAPLVINEICSANGKSIKDCDGESPDWIELYNPTGETVDLTGYRLSDDAEEPDKFVFPKSALAPYEYLVVFASRKLNMSPELHADFRLSSEGGESVYLFAPDGGIVDTATLPPLGRDVSYGRLYDGGGQLGKITPTPGKTNNASRAVRDAAPVAPPVFSHESGFYDGDILLSIAAPEGATVYYTLDGAAPTPESTPYTAPLALSDASLQENRMAARTDLSTITRFTPKALIDKCHVVRAMTVDAQGNQSEVVTNSYFVRFGEKSLYNDIPVISIVMNPSDLTDEQTGIYVLGDEYARWLEDGNRDTSVNAWLYPANYRNHGREWEREATIDYFLPDKRLLFSQQVGIRIHGNATRAYLQKSFNIYTRDEYGEDDLLFPLFEGVRKTDSIALRNGGNDVFKTKIRDVFCQTMTKDLAVDTQDSILCAVFLNGEYWGPYNVRQRYTDDYIENEYGIDKNNVVIVRGANGAVEEGEERDGDLYNDMVSAVTSMDMADEASYEKVSKLIDLNSLIDFYCAEIFFCNSDWPLNNTLLWRARTLSDRAYEDGLWRYLLTDVDLSLAYTESSSYDVNAMERARNNPLFDALIQNKSFRERFALTFMDIMNERFTQEKMGQLLDELEAAYAPQMAAYYRRFMNENRDEALFYGYMDEIRTFVERREEYIVRYLQEAFSLSAPPAELTLYASDPAMGGATVNTVSPDVTDGWTGRYFIDYPVALTAVPKAGYRFARWEIEGGSLLGDASAESVKVRLSAAGTKATAVFEPIADARERELLVEFYCDQAGAAIKGNSMQGYTATGGVFGANARLNASVDGEQGRKIEWSDLAYEDGGVTPVIRANGKNRWSERAYIDLSLSTLGYGDLRFSLRLGADWQGARAFTLTYSTDGRRYTEIKGAEIVISRPERMTAAYLDFALPDALKNQENLHIRLRANGDETVRGRAKLTGLTEGEVAFNDLHVTGVKIPVDTTAYRYAADALVDLTGLPQIEREAADALMGGFTTEHSSQREIDAQTEAIYAFAAALPFSRAAAGDALALLPDTARERAATIYLPGGIERLVYPVAIDLTAYETAYIYRFSDGAFTLVQTLTTEGKNAARAAFPQRESGIYLIFDKPLSVYCAAYTVTPAPARNAFLDDGLSDCLVSASARLDLSALGVGYDGTVEIDLTGMGFRGYVWAYRADASDLSRPAFSAPVRDGFLRAEGVAEGTYLLLSHNAKGILRSIERAQTLREETKKAPAGNRWLPLAGVAVGACALIGTGLFIARKKKKGSL